MMPPSMAPEGPPGEICYDMDTHTVDVTKTEETCEEMWLPAVDIPTTAAATTVHDSFSFSANFGPGYPDFETYSWQEAVDYASTLTYNGVNGHLATITTVIFTRIYSSGI